MDENQDWVQNAMDAYHFQEEGKRIKADICPRCGGPGYLAHKKNPNGSWKSPEVKAACDAQRKKKGRRRTS